MIHAGANHNTEVIDILELKLKLFSDLKDLPYYKERRSYEEKASLLYPLIAKEGFTNFVDIGMNYGFISMLMRMSSENINILGIEADPKLCSIIQDNFELNSLSQPIIVNALAGSTEDKNAVFSLNPHSTLDNRVHMDWEKVSVKKQTVTSILADHNLTGKTFFKTDTQGYEVEVLKGMEAFLKNNQNWMIKMEYGPKWLISQGADPLNLLNYLAENYEFVECPERIQYGTSCFNEMFKNIIQFSDCEHFYKYVRNLNEKHLGWVDLLVRPKSR